MRTPLFRLGFVLFSSGALCAAAACGGPKEGAGPNAPGSSGGTEAPALVGDGGEARPGAASEGTASGGGTTTTLQLGDGGDLQGAKLGSSVHTVAESKGDAGPKSPHGSANEPGRGAKDIQTAVAARRDEARACYDKGLAAHPGIEGDLDVKWVIDPQGNVTDAQVDPSKSQILEPSVGSCIVEVIKKIKFAPSAKGFETRAHYPFNFHPKTFGAKDAGK